MDVIKTVGIKNLKNNLSAFIRDLKRGTRILITDRDEVVAELREPTAREAGIHDNPQLSRWIQEGKVRPPLHKKRDLPDSPVRLPKGTVQALIDEDRAE